MLYYNFDYYIRVYTITENFSIIIIFEIYFTLYYTIEIETINKFGRRFFELEYTKSLIRKALESRKNAYTPYSHFKVGAALLTSDDKVYGGFNIECAAYSVCNCAERTALFRAVYDGHKNFKAIAVVGGKEGQEIDSYAPPCGMCRQALREFVDPKEFNVILAKNENEFEVYTLEDLLPISFGPSNL